jgi:hypothetical protein
MDPSNIKDDSSSIAAKIKQNIRNNCRQASLEKRKNTSTIDSKSQFDNFTLNLEENNSLLYEDNAKTSTSDAPSTIEQNTKRGKGSLESLKEKIEEAKRQRTSDAPATIEQNTKQRGKGSLESLKERIEEAKRHRTSDAPATIEQNTKQRGKGSLESLKERIEEAKRQRTSDAPTTLAQKAKRGKPEVYTNSLRTAALRPVDLRVRNGSPNTDTPRGRG